MNWLLLLQLLCLGLNLHNLYWDIQAKNYKHLPLSLGFSALMIYFLVK